MDCEAMRDFTRGFSLDNGPHGNQGYSRVLLQLFGYTGHGKSSFINSCKYVLNDGPYQVYAKVAMSEEEPETMIRKTYELTDTITLVDNRGCVKMNKYETGEIYAQLGNFLPLDTEVRWHSEFKDMLDILLNAETQDQSMDFIVPVLVYSAKTQPNPDQVTELQDLIVKARNITGLFPTVVITHKLSEHLPLVQETFRRMGVENMFHVENYTKEDKLKSRVRHEGILRCLQEIIKDVEFQMTERRDPVTEKIERKRILYEFANRRDLEQEREKKERRMREEMEKREREKKECRMREEMDKREQENTKPKNIYVETAKNIAYVATVLPAKAALFPFAWAYNKLSN